MRIGIIGTRGIPNQYGGFEQFAMFFAEFLVKNGYDVTVYNSSNHPYKESSWNGVKIQHCYDPEYKIGTLGQFVYDMFSILDSRKKNFDVIFQLGYTSSSIWGFLFPKSAKLITNMDGLEWKRTKYNKGVQKFLMKAESWAVKQSDLLIADSIGIQRYLKEKYQVSSTYIPYGANVFLNSEKKVLLKYTLEAHKYNLIIARLEPENNIEPIIEAHINRTNQELIIIGNYHTKYGKYLQIKYGGNVRFLGAVFNFDELNSLRYYSKIYFHGHSVGGTNPSLLEAMACSCFIVAHGNEFNKAVLERNAYYFKSSKDIEDIFEVNNVANDKQHFVNLNLKKIQTIYSFETIHKQLETLIKEC